MGAALAMFLMGMGSAAVAADFQVLVLNKGTDGKRMGFSPSYLHVEVGDSVTFIPVDRGHNAESILDMIPADAKHWKGKIDEEFTVTLTVPGLYAFACMPHFPMGMVGLVQVGDDRSNLSELTEVRLPGKSQGRMMELLAKTSPRK